MLQDEHRSVTSCATVASPRTCAGESRESVDLQLTSTMQARKTRDTYLHSRVSDLVGLSAVLCDRQARHDEARRGPATSGGPSHANISATWYTAREHRIRTTTTAERPKAASPAPSSPEVGRQRGIPKHVYSIGRPYRLPRSPRGIRPSGRVCAYHQRGTASNSPQLQAERSGTV